jgi:hypothetical protein
VVEEAMCNLRSGLLAVVAVTGAQTLEARPAIGAAREAGLGLEGSQLGMSLREWRAVPAPPGAGPDAIRVCSDQDKIGPVPGYPLSAREIADGVVVCTFKSRFGHDVETHSIDIGAGFSGDNVVYVFRRGRLDEIRFTASTDAYGHIRNMLGLTGGPSVRPASAPYQNKRPRIWTVDGHKVRVAPAPNATELTVDIRR